MRLAGGAERFSEDGEERSYGKEKDVSALCRAVFGAGFERAPQSALRPGQRGLYSGLHRQEMPEDVQAVEIMDEDAKRMTSEEAEWLFNANVEILARETKAQSNAILSGLSVRIANLEAALRAEKEKEQKGEDNG